MPGRSSFRAGLVASFVAAACCGAVARAVEPLAHFQCYRAESDARVDRTVTLTDQFGQIEARIEELYRICNPTDMNNQAPGAAALPEHLTEYTIRKLSGHVPLQRVSVTNQFGTFVLETGHNPPPRSILVPSAVSATPPAPPLPTPGASSHFTCYHVHRQPGLVNEPVELEDEIGTQSFNTRLADELCLPAKVDDEDVVDTDAPLVCYVLVRRGERPVSRTVHAADLFGSSAVQLLTAFRQVVCVPSTMVVLP
jgi:hypothetical protein